MSHSNHEEIISQLHQSLTELSVRDLNADGEWKWINDNKKKSFIEGMFDFKSLSSHLSLRLGDAPLYGLVSPVIGSELRSIGKHSMSAELWVDFFQMLRDLDQIGSLTKDIPAENVIDSLLQFAKVPSEWIHSLGSMFPDTFRHHYFAQKILTLMKGKKEFTVIEIGGGYGGVAMHLRGLSQNKDIKINYIIIDLLESLVVQHYALAANEILVNFYNKDMNFNHNDFTVSLVPIWENFNEIIDGEIILNTRSLSEMSQDTCFSYLNFINKSSADYFLTENSNYCLFPDSERHIEILLDEFDAHLTLFKRAYSRISRFHGGDDRYFEVLFKKLS